MSVFEKIGNMPEQFEQRYMPFPMALDLGMLPDRSEFNNPQKAAEQVMNGIMPPKRGVVSVSDTIGGYDLMGSELFSRKECVLPPTHTVAVDDEDRSIRDTGIITFSTDEGRVKFLGAVVPETDAFVAAKYGRLVNLGNGLVQVVFPFGQFPDQELKSKAGGILRTSARTRVY